MQPGPPPPEPVHAAPWSGTATAEAERGGRRRRGDREARGRRGASGREVSFFLLREGESEAMYMFGGLAPDRKSQNSIEAEGKKQNSVGFDWARILREQQQPSDGEIQRRREFKATWTWVPS
jgi:hypothetical protein